MKIGKFTTIAIIIFFAVNVVFNFSSWREIFGTSPPENISLGDSTLAEFIIENNYQNIIHGKNLFILKDKLFYPYEINLSLNDPGISNVIFYIFLRPFLSIHKSTLLIILFNNLLANIFMYFLLKKLSIDNKANLIASLSFGFMPQMPFRFFGHYTYTSIYLFPLIFLLIILFLEKKGSLEKLILSLLFGTIIALVLLLNFYYFISIILAFVFYSIYYFFKSQKTFFNLLKINLSFIPFSLIPFFIILIPWLDAVRQFVQFEGMVKTSGFGGAQVLSADLVGFLTPSEYNPFYHFIILRLGQISNIFAKYTKFYLYNWQKFVYPGLFIWSAYLYIFFFRKKIARHLWNKIEPHLIISIIFAFFTLGPFLKIFNRWILPLDEGINLVFPLPFLLLHYIPGLSSIRAPTRFSPTFLFLAYIVTGYIFQYLFTRFSKKKYLILGIILFIFIVDQFYILPQQETVPFPIKAYEYLQKQPGNETVLEIPFTVRDGFQYIGFVHAIGPMYGEFYHGKPIIGGYFARISPSVFTYYKDLPFIGYISRIIDKGNYEPLKEKPKVPDITAFTENISSVKKELDFLNLKYILLKKDEKYSSAVKDIISTAGFVEKFRDEKYDLYERQIIQKDFDNISFGFEGDEFFTAQGFSVRENGFRWTEGQLAKIFFKESTQQKDKLTLELASFYKAQNISVYVNNQFVGDRYINTEKTVLYFNISGKIKDNINTVIIRYSQHFQPTKVMLGSHDERDLAAKLFSLKIQ